MEGVYGVKFIVQDPINDSDLTFSFNPDEYIFKHTVVVRYNNLNYSVSLFTNSAYFKPEGLEFISEFKEIEIYEEDILSVSIVNLGQIKTFVKN